MLIRDIFTLLATLDRYIVNVNSIGNPADTI